VCAIARPRAFAWFRADIGRTWVGAQIIRDLARPMVPWHAEEKPSRASRMPSGIAPSIIEGVDNIRQGLAHWRVWHLLGANEFRRRYRRSRLGQTWVTLTTALFIGALGFTYSVLFRQPVASLLPWVGISVIMWNHLSAIARECTTIFAAHGPYYLNQKMVLSVSIISVIYRNAIILAHNMVIAVVLIILFGVPVNWNTLALAPGLLICWLALLCAGYVLGMMCIRFRDVAQVVENINPDRVLRHADHVETGLPSAQGSLHRRLQSVRALPQLAAQPAARRACCARQLGRGARHHGRRRPGCAVGHRPLRAAGAVLGVMMHGNNFCNNWDRYDSSTAASKILSEKASFV
jgi:ABC-2 type transporter